MITAVGTPDPEEPKEVTPKTIDEQIADYRVFRRETLTNAATVFSLPRTALKNVLVNAANTGQ